jgi:hypothetical protein
MELERRQTCCPGCDGEYPAACGFCPACGTPALEASVGTSFSVIVPAIPSARLRSEVAARVERILDCPHGAAALERALAEDEVRLVDNLDEIPAKALAGALARLHVQGVRVEPTGASPGTSRWTWIPGYLPALLGLVVGTVTAIPFVAGLIGGAVLSALALTVHGRRREKAALSAFAMPIIAGSLPAWKPVAQPLAALLRELPAPLREPLGTLATTTAFILDESAECGAATSLLEAGMATARGALESKADSVLAQEELRRLAAAAQQARTELEGLPKTASLEDHQAIARRIEQATRLALPPRI